MNQAIDSFFLEAAAEPIISGVADGGKEAGSMNAQR
jgi:hypothetical protein